MTDRRDLKTLSVEELADLASFQATRIDDPAFDAALEAGSELVACWSLGTVLFLGLCRLGSVFVVQEAFEEPSFDVRMWTGFTDGAVAIAYFEATHQHLDATCVGDDTIGCAFMDPRCPRYLVTPHLVAEEETKQ